MGEFVKGTLNFVHSILGGAFRCVWEPAPPYSRKKFKRIARGYRPWRNRILSEWAKRTGQRVLVVEM